MAFSFSSRKDVFVILSLSLGAILIELINGDQNRYNPLQQQQQSGRQQASDPIDPTGADRDRDSELQRPPSKGYYDDQRDRGFTPSNFGVGSSSLSQSSGADRPYHDRGGGGGGPGRYQESRQNYPPPPPPSHPPQRPYDNREITPPPGRGNFQPSGHFNLDNRNKIPQCAASDDQYCLIDRDYPMEKVKNIAQNYGNRLSSLYEELNHYSMQDYMKHDNLSHIYREKGHFICESDVSYVRPGWAKNWKGEWVAVLNTDVMPQSVRIETCKYPKKKCEYMPPCYKSYCVQRYTYVKLITVDPDNPDKKPTIDVFEIPSACSCFVENFALY